MACKPIEIGHVVRLSGEVAGFVVNVTRYGNGRLLPAPRTLLAKDGRPFASALEALNALATWKNAPRNVRQLHKDDQIAAPVAPAPKPAIKSGNLTGSGSPTASEASHKRSRKIKRANTPLPAITKLLPERPTQIIRDRRTKTQALIDMLIASGQATVTRCAEFRRPNLDPKRGGILPAHLDPVTIS